MTELYKKHRPRSLQRVLGNSETVATLRNMIDRGTLPHTILFHGPSGCGKTTLARILAKKLDCHPMDLKEVNSSSFRGIDSIREIGSLINLAPIGTCRIWIMDEVHKLSNDAQNAALKMLEDTPRHVYFFLCTTHPRKLIKAIQTRCCEMPVRPLNYKELELLVRRVAKREKITLSDRTLDHLVASAQGSARTVLVLLDKVANLDDADRTLAIESQLEAENEGIELCRALTRKTPWPKVVEILKGLKADPETIRWSVLGYARAVLLNKKPNSQAFFVIQAFSEPFYDSKEAGLVAACYEAIVGD